VGKLKPKKEKGKKEKGKKEKKEKKGKKETSVVVVWYGEKKPCGTSSIGC